MQFVPVNKLSSHRESKDASEKLESSEGEFSSGEENRSRANFLCCSNFEGKIGKFHRFWTMEKISLAALLPPFTVKQFDAALSIYKPRATERDDARLLLVSGPSRTHRKRNGMMSRVLHSSGSHIKWDSTVRACRQTNEWNTYDRWGRKQKYK